MTKPQTNNNHKTQIRNFTTNKLSQTNNTSIFLTKFKKQQEASRQQTKITAE